MRRAPSLAPSRASRSGAPWRSSGSPQRLAERLAGCAALAQALVEIAEREPGGGEAGRDLDRLRQQVGGGGEIAARGEVARELKPAVGQKVAGGEEQRAVMGIRLLPLPMP